MTDLEQFIATCEAHAVPDNEIDFSDIPELTDEQVAQMKPSHLVNKNMWKPQKKVLSIRIDADLLESLKASGKGWQTRLNDWIRNGVSSHYF